MHTHTPEPRPFLRAAALAALTGLALVACSVEPGDGMDDTTGADTGMDTGMDETTGDTGATGIEIAGDYTDEWTMVHSISDTEWTQDADTYMLSQYDNDADFTIGENGPNNAFNPGLWSRFDWTWAGEDLFYCQTTFDSATEADALAATPADPSDPASSGCGAMSFPWTKLN